MSSRHNLTVQEKIELTDVHKYSKTKRQTTLEDLLKQS